MPEGASNHTSLSSDSLWQLLGSFDVVVNRRYACIVPSFMASGAGLRNLQSAIGATLARTESIDYFRRQYMPTDADAADGDAHPDLVALDEAFHAGSGYMREARERMDSSGAENIPMGCYAASVALERLSGSFRAARLLYRLGLNYEGDAVSRQALEQIAWAYAVQPIDDLDKVAKVSASRSVTLLRRQVPVVGRLYGQLSGSAHLGLVEHHPLVTFEDGRPAITYTWNRARASARILLQLADLWVIIWEWVNREYFVSLKAIAPTDDLTVLDERSFKVVAEDILQRGMPGS